MGLTWSSCPCARGARGSRRHIQDFLHYKKNRNLSEPGQDSPFWTLETGGCIKSLNGPRASFRAELTSDEEHVTHSTSVGYRAITWAHVLPSTADGKQSQNKRNKNNRKGRSGDGRERKKRIWIVIGGNQRNHFPRTIPTGVWKWVLLWIKRTMRCKHLEGHFKNVILESLTSIYCG